MNSVRIIVVAIALVAAACTGQTDAQRVATLEPDSGNSASDTQPTDVVADTEAAMLEYTQCLRDQGFDVDDPTMGPDGAVVLPPIEFAVELDDPDAAPDFSEFEEKLAVCEELLGGVMSLGSGAGDAEFADAMLEYAQCMRDNGIDMPDPDMSGDGIIDLSDVDDAAFETADAVCRDVFTSFTPDG